MRQAAKPTRRTVKSSTASISAPVGGWNARDSLSAMDSDDAVILQNIFPLTSEVALRGGYINWATGLGSQVESVMAYSGLTTNKMLAAAGTSIFDVTIAGAVGAAVQTGLTNARWQYVNYANTSGNYLYMVNGADSPRYWDGTTWTNAAITVVTPTNLIDIHEHKNRLWFVEKNTLNGWYLPTSALAGAAVKFDLTGIALLGGYLVAISTWTIDAGYGVDDLLVFVTSNGEVLVYRGTDPSDATKWALVGLWQIGTPVGRRCMIKYAGDLLIIGQDGVYPMSGALQSSRTNPKVAITDKIQYAVSTAISSYSNIFGWQIINYPRENALLLNVPFSVGSQQQFVMNTITKSWCNFTGWNANCFEVFNDYLFFGGNGAVCQAWTTKADNGRNINGIGLQAFSNYGSPGKIKQYKMMKPYFRSDGSPSISASINVDFDLSDMSAALSFSPTTSAVWDTALWDVGVWGGGLSVLQNWQGVSGIGQWGAPFVKIASNALDVRWVSTTIVMEQGQILG